MGTKNWQEFIRKKENRNNNKKHPYTNMCNFQRRKSEEVWLLPGPQGLGCWGTERGWRGVGAPWDSECHVKESDVWKVTEEWEHLVKELGWREPGKLVRKKTMNRLTKGNGDREESRTSPGCSLSRITGRLLRQEIQEEWQVGRRKQWYMFP